MKEEKSTTMFVITNLKQRKQNTSSSSASTRKDSFSFFSPRIVTTMTDIYMYIYIYIHIRIIYSSTGLNINTINIVFKI